MDYSRYRDLKIRRLEPGIRSLAFRNGVASGIDAGLDGRGKKWNTTVFQHGQLANRNGNIAGSLR